MPTNAKFMYIASQCRVTSEPYSSNEEVFWKLFDHQDCINEMWKRQYLDMFFCIIH